MIILGNLSSVTKTDWELSNKDVLWGWKRNVGAESRLVFYSAQIDQSGAVFHSHMHYFHYVHRTDDEVAQAIAAQFEMARPVLSGEVGDVRIGLRRHGSSLSNVTVEIGEASDRDRDLVRRLKSRRRRLSLAPSSLPLPSRCEDPIGVFPADLYVGSGLSYEAGIPTLCDMHQAFGVDRPDGSDFATGKDDLLPAEMAECPLRMFRRFAAVHVTALQAEPTASYKAIAHLVDRGLVGKIFSDNVDNMIGKVGVPFERTRGSGVMNERHGAEFTEGTLIVIGVAADRRQVIRQARRRGMRIVVVNPCQKVSPNVQHMNYLNTSAGDLFFKCTAAEFFANVLKQLPPSQVAAASLPMSSSALDE